MDAGAFVGVVGGGEAVVGEAGGQGGDTGVEVDVAVVGKVGFDGLQDGGGDAGQAAIVVRAAFPASTASWGSS